MNELIKERTKKLVEQVAAEYPDAMRIPGCETTYKLVELIVRECVHVAQQWEDDCGTDYNSGRTWAGIDIMKHFGVE